AFVFIGLTSQADADLQAFAEKVKSWPIVRESYILSGEVDFLLKCVAVDLRTFQSFVIDEVTSAPHVGSVRTALSIRRVKNEPLVARLDLGRADRHGLSPWLYEVAPQVTASQRQPRGLSRRARRQSLRALTGRLGGRRFSPR